MDMEIQSPDQDNGVSVHRSQESAGTVIAYGVKEKSLHFSSFLELFLWAFFFFPKMVS